MVVKAIGVRELKANPGKYLRMARDEGRIIDLTIRGEVVARLVPVNRKPDPEELARFWELHEEVGKEISRHWPEGLSAVDVMREERREL